MKVPQLLSFRQAAGLAAAGAALLTGSAATAQTAPTPVTFQVVNSTYSGGDPTFSVTDDLTFTNLQINEMFANGFSQTLFLNDLATLNTDPMGGFEFSDKFASSSPLTSAILTGSIGPGPAQTVTLATDLSGNTTSAYVSSNFSANLFGPAPAGTALGTFSLTSGPNNSTVLNTVNIIAPAAVPEASTTVSMGLLMALGLGALSVARRRAVSAN